MPPCSTTHALAEVVRRHRERLVSEASAAAVRLHAADRLIARLEEHDMSTTVPVTRTTLPARTVASVRGMIPTYADERLLWERLAPGMKAAGAVPAPDALAVAVFHDDDYVDENPDVEVQITVAAPFAGRRRRALPRGARHRRGPGDPARLVRRDARGDGRARLVDQRARPADRAGR